MALKEDGCDGADAPERAGGDTPTAEVGRVDGPGRVGWAGWVGPGRVGWAGGADGAAYRSR